MDVLTTGHYSSEERGMLAQVWKKGEAQVLSIPTFQCKFGIDFPYIGLLSCNNCGEKLINFMHLSHLQFSTSSH